jgi:hypothetical protein
MAKHTEKKQTDTTETPSDNAIIIVSKMSIKTIGCNPRAAAAMEHGKGNFIALCRIYGMATGSKAIEDSTSGVIHQPLTGNFEAQNFQTNKIIRSGILYLPKGIHDMILEAVGQLKPKESVNFALELRAVPASNPIGYSYEAIPLIKPVEVDPLEAMRQALPRLEPLKAIGSGK